jgi:hypothetical protein
MSFAAWASRRWIRVGWSGPTESRNLFGGSQTRTVERITARTDVAAVDSQTVLADIGTNTTLPTIYYGGGATDGLSGGTGWTPLEPSLQDLEGGNCRVTVTWQKAGAWS